MKKNFCSGLAAVLVLLYPAAASADGGPDLSAGVWYISFPENSGELRTSGAAFRFHPDGRAEMVLPEPARRQMEDMRKKFRERNGKEMPRLVYDWKFQNGQLELQVKDPQGTFRRSGTYVFDGDPRILMAKDRRQIILLARRGAKLSPAQAKRFFMQVREATRDRFADGLKLPENVPLAEPEEENGTPFPGRFHWRNGPEDSFQRCVLSAIGRGPKLAEDAQCRLPALEKLLADPGKKAVLLQYLACHPEWRLYRERNGHLHAVRCFRLADGTVTPTLNQFYSFFRPTDPAGKKTGDPASAFQFRLDLALDGTPWNGNSLFPRDKTEHKGNAWNTRFRCGTALVDICDRSEFPGRQMTAAALAFLEKEFSRLSDAPGNWRQFLPPDSFLRGKPGLVLRNGMQGGIYSAACRCNPGERGTIYLKAFEITKGTALSAPRLKASSGCVSGWSDDPREQFFSPMYFTIYEGEWGQFYGARFEVWFKPDSGGAERKLFEKNYRIQGWQR